MESKTLCMDLKIKCMELKNKPDYFSLTISTYKEKIEGRFEMSELRNMIAIIDNSINVGLKG